MKHSSASSFQSSAEGNHPSPVANHARDRAMRSSTKNVPSSAGKLFGALPVEELSKPTIVLVHGAFADSSCWTGVVADLAKDGYAVLAVANPLRGLASDAAYLSALLKSVKGPVVLVGHSYGGAVISIAANEVGNVKALVYVAAFVPDTGESCLDLSHRFPGPSVPPTLAPPVPLADGGQDLYVQGDRFAAQLAADVPANQCRAMAAMQRPIKQAALLEAASAPAWKTIQSWAIYGTDDRAISPETLAFMAQRANAQKVVAINGASHVVMISHPHQVAALIEKAATAAH